MTALIQWIVDSTLSLTALLVLLLVIRRHVARHLGAGTAYCLWLLVPVHLTATLLVPAGMAAYQIELAPLTVQIGGSGFAGGYWRTGFWWGAGLVWALGAGYVLMRLLLAIAGGMRLVRESFPATMRNKNLLADACPSSIEMRESSAIRSPTVAGLFRPALLLPGDFFTSYSTAEQRLILIHEICHMRRRDNLATVAAWTFTALLWFNPFVHIAYRAFRADQELSCDARVLAKANDSERKAYGRALVKSAATMEPVAVTSSWQNINDLKERTMMLKSHRNTRVRRLAGYGTFAALFIAVVLLSVDALAYDAETKSAKAQPALDAPAIAVRVNPRYPRAAAEDKIEGHVAMRFLVSTDGSVKDIEVIESSPKGLFEDEAIEAMKQWRFNPGRMEGEAVPMKAVQVIRFELD